MMTTTKFTNNVLRAKAVKKITIGKPGNMKKFTNKVVRGKAPAINLYPGQTVPGKKRSSTSAVGGPGAQMSIHKQSIKGY